MTKSTMGRLNKEKCITVVHFYDNRILQSKAGKRNIIFFIPKGPN